jgi:hypothetical protein
MPIRFRECVPGLLAGCSIALAVAGCSDQATPGPQSAGSNATGATGAAGTGGAAGSVAGSPSGGGGVANASGGTAGSGGSLSGASGSGSSAGGQGNAGQASSAAGGAMGGTAGSGGAAGQSGGGGGGTGGTDATQVQLFDGKDLSSWKARDGGGPAPWQVSAGAYFEVVPNSGDIVTKQSFGDIQLHVEFWIPSTPTTNSEQDRGNSGIYLQGRYEVQVLDSYMHPLQDKNDCGAIYEVKDADVNASMPPETWQTYEITFHAPKWSGNTKTSNARISVIWNGQQAQKDTEVPGPTKLGDAEAPGDAPLRLQDHGHHVRYRNIWLKPL